MLITAHELGRTIPPLARGAHAAHSNRCMSGLPNSQTEIDSSRYVTEILLMSRADARVPDLRLAVAFYCLGSLDLLGMLKEKTSKTDREVWREWIWEQQTRLFSFPPSASPPLDSSETHSVAIGGRYGTGFKPSSYMTAQHSPDAPVSMLTHMAFESIFHRCTFL